MKRIFKALIWLIILACIGAFSIYSYYNSQLNSKILTSTQNIRFDITEGLTTNQILDKLVSESVITKTQSDVLKIHFKLTKSPIFKVGTYLIPSGIALTELSDALQNAVLTDIWVTIPEGLRKDEIAKIIAKAYQGKEGAEFSEKDFLKLSENKEYIYSLGLPKAADLEGYLYPDKYLLPAQATTDYVIRTLVKTHKEKAGEITYEQLIIASMIEREGLTDEDRPMISDVIYKRLRDGWLLQIDATLLYQYKDWKHVITVDNKKENHPYNTYVRAGLPPTPICNPGFSAIKAAKEPKKNPYYFYIHANNGNVYFAENLAQHEANIAKYLR